MIFTAARPSETDVKSCSRHKEKASKNLVSQGVACLSSPSRLVISNNTIEPKEVTEL